MKLITSFLSLLVASVAAMAQPAPNIVRNQFTTNSIPTNTVVSGLSTNKGRIQFQTANTNTYQFGGNGTTFSFFDNVSGITFWSYDHSTDKLTVTLGTQEIVGTIKAQIYQAGSGASGATGTSSDWVFEDGLATTIGTVGSATPAGNSGDLQFNQAEALGATNRLHYNRTNDTLTVTGSVVVSTIDHTFSYINAGADFISSLYFTHGALNVPSFSLVGDTNWVRLQPDFGTTGHYVQGWKANRAMQIGSTQTLKGTNVGDWYFPSNVTAKSFSGGDTGIVSEVNFYDATGGGAKRVQLKAANVINNDSSFTLPTNHMGGNSVGFWIVTNASGGTNGQIIIAALGKDLEVSSDGKTIQNRLGYVPSAAGSGLVVDRTIGKVFMETNRATGNATLVLTNHSVGDFSTFLLPGEAAGGTDRDMVVAVAAGDLIQVNDMAPVASYTIVRTNGIVWEGSVLKASFRNTNYWRLKLNWNPQ